MPKLPTEEQLTTLISGAGKALSLKLWLSKKTGLRPTELQDLAVRDIDTAHNIVLPTTAKHGAGRPLSIPPELTKTIETLIIKKDLKPTDKIFKGNAKKFGNAYREMRSTLAKKLNRPDLLTVRLYDFRHFFGTMQYWKYRDVGLTAQDMGHKDWNTTQKYVHLLRIIELTKDDGFVTKTATTVKECQELIEAGFTKADEIDGIHIYKKRK